MLSSGAVEGGSDQNAKPQNHRYMEPACDAQMRLQRSDGSTRKPDIEQAAHQIGGRHACLQEQPAGGKRQRKGYNEAPDICQNRCGFGRCGAYHVNQVQLLPCG